MTTIKPFLSRLRRRMALLLLPAILTSCDLLDPGPEHDRAELERSWRMWQLNGGSDYTYVQQRLCYCTTEAIAAVRISVRDGVVTDRRRYDDNAQVSLQYANLWGTVEDLFQIIDDALLMDAASLLVSYDQRYGYPTHIAIDYRTNVADDELTITANGLALISGANQH